MIAKEFLTGNAVSESPEILGITWKALDLYNATRHEGVRIRLSFMIQPGMDIEEIYTRAVRVHAIHGAARVRRNKWNR